MADWYEEHKNEFYLNLHKLAWELIENLDEDCLVPEKALDSDFKRWYHKNETAIQILINMHQFGYEVEKEPEYIVKVKGMNSMNGYLARNKNLGTWYFGISGNDKNHCTNHTRKELEDADFGWVFNCEGIEIKEVE